MSLLLRAFFVAVLVLLAPLQASAQKAYVREDLASSAIRLEARLKKELRPAGLALDKLKRDGEAAVQRIDHEQVLAIYAKAAAMDPKDWSLWNRYAHAAASALRANYSDRYQLRTDATAAAYLAYQRAGSRADEATALATLGYAFAQQEYWRSALDAYRDSLKLVENPDVRRRHTELREKHGFRFSTASVDNDAASPRACFEFTESLVRNTDYSPYVTVSGIPNPAVTAEGRQICVDGLEHGKRYGIVIRAGLPSAVGEDLLKPIDYDTYVKDRSAQVRFTGRNYVLPSTGQEGLPIVSVNTKSVDVEIYRIGDRSLLPTLRGEDFLTSLSGYQTDKIRDEQGVKVWTGSLDTKSDLNKDVVTGFPVLEAVGKLEPGIYIMTAVASGAKPDEYENRATQWFVVSDIGLTAMTGPAGATVLARSLASAEPLPGVEVRLVAKNNEVLGTQRTDAQGMARFEPGLMRGTGGASPGLVVAANPNKADYGFLDLAGQAFDLTDRGVAGRIAPTGLDAFVFTERGVYRSGENVYVTALLRDTRGAAAPGMPITLVAKRPDGAEYRRQVVEDQGEGGRAWSLPLIAGLPTGTWRVEAYADPKRPAIGETTFLLEDYVPERLELVLKPAAERLRAGEPARVAVEARHLYGAAAAELEVSGEISVSLAKKTTVPGLDGWTIGLDDESFEAVNQEMEETVTTDENGKADVVVPMPQFTTTRPVEAKVTLRVSEEGGRAVERAVTLPVLPSASVIAVRKKFDDEALTEGSTAEFDVAYATPDGERRARAGVTWELSRVHRRFQWYNSEGRWDYETITSTSRQRSGKVDIAAAEPARIAVPVEWGHYRLDLTDAAGAHTSIGFSVGYGGSDKPDTPDVLDVKLDRSAFRSGEDMRIHLAPRFAGKATVAIVADGTVDSRVVDVTPAGATVSIPVKADWGAGAYVVAFAHRPLDVAAHRMPGRAIGVAWFGIDADRHKVGVALDVPPMQRPRGPITIPVKLAGLAPGENAAVVVAAVDLGILNLTRYETPDPDRHYFGQRQLSAEIRDLYGYLIDGMQGARGTIRSGGDEAPKTEGAAPREQPLARYSGVVRVGPDGTAAVQFDLPAFNGTLRVMAVAWSKDRVGHAQADVIVRDPVVVQATLPRFLSLGDRSQLHMAIDNVEAPAGDYTVDVDIHGPVVAQADSLRRPLALKKGGRSELVIPVTAAGVGTAVVDVKLAGQGLDLNQQLVLKVQPATPAVYRRTVQPLAPGASISIGPDLVTDFVAGTGIVSMTVAPVGAFDVPALLKALDRYPYGCSEQIVSRAMPLLYVNRLAREEHLALDEAIDKRIRDAVDKVMSRQDSNGSFGLWSSESSDNAWLDAFVTDFLTRAREKGFDVPKVGFDLALDRLRNFVANAEDPSAANAPELAYAIYVLARNGRPVIGDLRYLVDQKLTVFETPLARAQLGAALAMLGDRTRAEPIFLAAMDRLAALREDRGYRADYGSALRDGAGLMAMMAEAGFGQATFQRASMIVDEVRAKRRYTSTQENAWMVVAAHAMLKDTERLTLAVNGQAHQGALYRSLRGLALVDAPVTVTNTSSTPAQLVVTASGHPIQPEPALASGYAVERSYHKLDGTRVDPSKVRQTDRLVVVLKVTEDKALPADLLLVDHLPAGFEIDNPKLLDKDENDKFAWLDTSVEPLHTEYRDDRFVAAFDRRADQSAFFHVAYTIRAVAPGTYVHPPAVVEDMYRPERFGRTGTGTVEVTAKK